MNDKLTEQDRYVEEQGKDKLKSTAGSGVTS